MYYISRDQILSLLSETRAARNTAHVALNPFCIGDIASVLRQLSVRGTTAKPFREICVLLVRNLEYTKTPRSLFLATFHCSLVHPLSHTPHQDYVVICATCRGL